LGEGYYDESERTIIALLKENRAAGPSGDPLRLSADGVEAPPGRDVRTPETYVAAPNVSVPPNESRAIREGPTLCRRDWALAVGD